MATLSELVKFRNDLIELKKQIDLESTIKRKLNSLSTLQGNNLTIDCEITNRDSYLLEIQNLNRKFQTSISEWIQTASADIDSAASVLTSNADYTKFAADQVNDEVTVDSVLSDPLRELITTRIKSYCDWHYPSLQIGCRFKQWTDCMVTSDPLYLTNYYPDMITRTTTTYPEEYQRRLRVYPISCHDLSKHLPIGQFGFVLSWEILNYASRDEIRKILSQTFNLLRPGGTFMFSYNNCDLPESANLAEIGAMSYIRKQHLYEIITSLGYSITSIEDQPTNDPLYAYISWFEIKKPGALQTSKTHQAIGKIIEK